jgi:hypothetical protein
MSNILCLVSTVFAIIMVYATLVYWVKRSESPLVLEYSYPIAMTSKHEDRDININAAQGELFARQLLSDPARFMEKKNTSDVIMGQVNYLKPHFGTKSPDGSRSPRRIYVMRHAERISIIQGDWAETAFIRNGEILCFTETSIHQFTTISSAMLWSYWQWCTYCEHKGGHKTTICTYSRTITPWPDE